MSNNFFILFPRKQHTCQHNCLVQSSLSVKVSLKCFSVKIEFYVVTTEIVYVDVQCDCCCKEWQVLQEISDVIVNIL